MLGENAISAFAVNKCSRKERSSLLTEEIAVVELDDFNREVVLHIKAAGIDDNGTPSRRRKTKDENTEIEPNDRTMVENTTEQLTDHVEAMDIASVKNAQTSTKRLIPVVYTGLDDRLGHQLPSAYTESLMKIDVISCR